MEISNRPIDSLKPFPTNPRVNDGAVFAVAEQTGRKGYLMELDALYCDVIVQRWENFTGKKASLLSSTTTVMPNNP